MILPLVLLALAFVPMALEARRSRINHRALVAAGAREPADDAYRLMQFAYPASFAAMALEAWVRRRGMSSTFAAGLIVFGAAKALKYWAIATLGPRWAFRVLVLPGAPLIRSGPYRFLRHPNYVGVDGELIGMALMAQAPITGTIAVTGFTAILVARIRVEERELGIGR
jgi:methyltransferase